MMNDKCSLRCESRMPDLRMKGDRTVPVGLDCLEARLKTQSSRSQRWWLGLIVFGGFSLVLCPALSGGLARADEPLQVKETDEDSPSPARNQPVDGDRTDQDLLDRMEALEASPDERELADRAVEQMRRAEQDLEADKTGEATQDAQRKAVKNLDELIKRLKQQNSSSSSSSSSSSTSSSSSSSSSKSRSFSSRSRKQQRQQQRQGQQPSEGSSGQQGSDPQAGQSPPGGEPGPGGKQPSDNQGNPEKPDGKPNSPNEEERRKKLETDVWGHLPPALREQLLNTYGGRTLPKYEELVKQFYESLTEQSTKPNRTK